MSRLEHLNVSLEEKSKIDWRSCISKLISSKTATSDRELEISNFVSRIREELPETKWYFSVESGIDLINLRAFQHWFFKQVARPDWPFPTSVFINLKQDKLFSARIFLIQTKNPLPSFLEMKGVTHKEIQDLTVKGWEVTVSQESLNFQNLKDELK